MEQLIEKIRTSGPDVLFTTEDFTRYAGYPVGLCHLAEIPHWEELFDGRICYAQETERRAALSLFLKEFYARVGPLGDYDWTLTDSEIEETAGRCCKETSSCLRWFIDTETLVRGHWGIKGLFRQTFPRLREGRISPDIPSYCVGLSGDDSGKNRHIVLPTTAGEEAFDPDGNPFRIRNEGYVLLQGAESDRKDISSLCEKPLREGKDIPVDGLFYAFSALHEMRHTRQGIWEHPIADMYAELDADFFAASVIEKAGWGGLFKTHI